jgi:energy-coupling factor transporter ATP-binding protein EcfA2
LYGLVIRSARPLEGLDAATPGAPIDVEIAMAASGERATAWSSVPPYFTGPAEPDGRLSLLVQRDAALGYRFEYADGTQFVMDPGARFIACWRSEASTLEDTATYLLGPVLGFALRLRGVLALHASAVLIDGRAVALVGPSGAGKSTTAAAFAAAGYSVIADDVLAVRTADGAALAYPSYRLLRLWDASERLLFGTEGQLPLLTPTWEKRALALGTDFPFHPQPAPLGALFVLDQRQSDDRAPFVETMSPGDAFIALVANSYANYLLDDPMRVQEMRSLESLVRGRPVHRLVPHSDPARLAALVRTVGSMARAR